MLSQDEVKTLSIFFPRSMFMNLERIGRFQECYNNICRVISVVLQCRNMQDRVAVPGYDAKKDSVCLYGSLFNFKALLRHIYLNTICSIALSLV